MTLVWRGSIIEASLAKKEKYLATRITSPTDPPLASVDEIEVSVTFDFSANLNSVA
jgi:hypothetical protein